MGMHFPSGHLNSSDLQAIKVRKIYCKHNNLFRSLYNWPHGMSLIIRSSSYLLHHRHTPFPRHSRIPDQVVCLVSEKDLEILKYIIFVPLMIFFDNQM